MTSWDTALYQQPYSLVKCMTSLQKKENVYSAVLYFTYRRWLSNTDW